MDTVAFVKILADHFGYVTLASCFLGAVVVSAITKIVTTVSRERSRREIAAYIAEGSIGPEQGERLIRAEVSQGQVRT